MFHTGKAVHQPPVPIPTAGIAARRGVRSDPPPDLPRRAEPRAAAAAIGLRVEEQLRRSAWVLGLDLRASPLADVRSRAGHLLGQIAARPPAGAGAPLRLGVYPVAGNPLHWGHLLGALQAITSLRLDRVAFVIQGLDERKRALSEATHDHRHAMAPRVLSVLAPLAEYCDVGRGRATVGEDNLFALLRRHRGRRVEATYLAGADHYRAADPQGRPDTLARLERNLADPAVGHDRAHHSIRVAFVERGPRGPEVPTALPVTFLPGAFDASSTAARAGDLSRVPYEVIRYIASSADYRRFIGPGGGGTASPSRARGVPALRPGARG